MAQIGVGIVGLDHWYNVLPLLQQFKSAEEFQVIMLGDDNEERAKELAADFGAEWTTNTSHVISDPRVQLVAIFSSTDRSAALAIEAAHNGKNVLANKPIGMSLAEANEVVEEVERAGVHYFPYESYARLTSLFQTIRRWVSEGRVGDIQTIFFSHEASVPVEWKDSDRPGWWTMRDRTPGGGWIDHAIYQVDLMRWLAGAEVVRSDGQIGNIRHKNLSVEDFGTATFLLSSGAVATCEAHWLAPKGAFRRVVEVVGTEGVVLFDSTDDRIRVNGPFEPAEKGGDNHAMTRGGEGWHNIPIPERNGAVLLDHIARVVRGEVQPVATASDGKANLEICLNFYKSATTIL